jgi:DNA repair ATPase RecN
LVVAPSKPPIAHRTCEPPPADAVAVMLDYADRVQLMSPAELGQEITRFGDSATPADQVQLSLALSQLHQLPELVRAQELLGRVLANAGEQAQPLQPLSRLLSSRYGEQRRLSDLLDKQTQQTREVQRRLDQTNERLEALKAIERSLTSRPPSVNATPQAGQAQRSNVP